MKPEQFEVQAWSIILHEAAPEEARQLLAACAGDEFLAARFERLQRDYRGLGDGLQALAAVQAGAETGAGISVARLDHLMASVAAGAAVPPIIPLADAAADRGPAPKAPPPRSASGWAWAGGLAAALILGLLKIMTHEVGPLVKMASKGAAEVGTHEAGRVAKQMALEAAELEAREVATKLAARQAAANMRIARGEREVRRAVATAAGAATVAPLAAESPLLSSVQALGLRYEKVTEGAKILEVLPDSPAAAMGLRVGDIVVAFDRLPSGRSAGMAFSEQAPRLRDSEFELTFRRGEEQRTVKITDPFHGAFLDGEETGAKSPQLNPPRPEDAALKDSAPQGQVSP